MTDCVVLSRTLNPGGTRAVTETLSELICRVRGTELDLGTLSGTCCICGKPTEHGHKFDIGPGHNDQDHEPDICTPILGHQSRRTMHRARQRCA